MKQNLHTHTLFCDGKNTPEEMVQSAISHGFSSLGFSSHVHTGFAFDTCGISSAEKTDEYFSELDRLKEKYKEKLGIYKGLELESRDMNGITPKIDERCDYSIGSIHWFRKGDEHWEVDWKSDIFLQAAEAFGGFRPLIESYYEEVKRFASVSPYSITGHIDLVTKFTEKTGWDFEKEEWYRDAALSAVEECISNGKIIEVNTGAISRGYRTSPYPAPFILKYIKEKNAPITLTSDCHDARFIDMAFAESEEMLSSIGFRELYILTPEGFRPEGMSRNT
ncbi:MAG: histidinol-phosphatase [Bullifex sp.]